MGILRADRVSGLGGANAINGSVKFSKGTDALIVPPSSDFNFGTGDYTIEAWVYPEEEGRSQMIYAVGDSDSTAAMGKFYFRSTNKFTYWCQSSAHITSTTTYTMGSWYHVALVNNSGTQTLYVNGTSQGTSTYGSGFGGDAFDVNVGKNPSNTGQSFNGYISNLRIQKGKAEYTGAFTTPTTRLEKTPETVLLCCQSSGDVIQETTGKSLIIGKASGADLGPVAARFAPDKGEDHGTTFEDNTKFDTLSYMVPPGGTTAQSNRGRGLWMGGYAPSQYRTMIDFVNIQSMGNAIDFGVLSGTTVGEGADCASSTRAIQGGGSLVNTMEYVTIATTSNTTNFGDLTVARRSLDSLSSETRGIWAGGTTNPAMSDVIDYVTIATTGDATDFGNLTVGRRNMGTAASPTRGVFAGGNPGSSPLTDDTIDYITIASTGDATDFGNLSGTYREMAGCSNGTRGIFAGGGPGSSSLNTIEFITIANTGNTTDFGDLFYAAGNLGGTSNGTRGVFGGGSGAAYTNIIQFITIATTGNAADFGDLTFARITYSATSDSHGGIS